MPIWATNAMTWARRVPLSRVSTWRSTPERTGEAGAVVMCSLNHQVAFHSP